MMEGLQNIIGVLLVLGLILLLRRILDAFFPSKPPTKQGAPGASPEKRRNRLKR